MGFLQDNGLDLQAIDAQALLETFLGEMGAGLHGEGSLPMIPSDLHLPEGAIRDAEFPAFDVGGTNIRSARVRFGSSGAPTVEGLQRGFMPGSRGHVTHAEFYRILCAVLTGNLRPGETLGYCFSYPVDEGGRLLYWTKGIQADDIVGTDVRDDLAAALAERGLPGCRVRILNDTVAALLAAYAHGGTGDYAGVVGFILGTGTNTAYAERAERIVKRPDLTPGALVPVNCESGNFARFPHSAFDEAHERAIGTGHGQWEHCISGAHLGNLGTIVLRAAADAGLLSPGLGDTVRSRGFSNIELDDFCAGRRDDVLFCTAAEARAVRALLIPLYERAALFAAINVAAAGIASARARGRDAGVIRVNADGSTLWKTACIPFVDRVRGHLETLLGPRGYTAEILRIDDAPLIGAALAAAAR